MYQGMMKSELDKLLRQGLIQGQNPRQLATHLQKLFGTSKYNAERLMRTELARVQIEAQKQSFEQNGYEEYVFLALGTACEVCRKLDEKHFKVKDMVPGENAPPMHPNCRCSTAAYISRAANGENSSAMSTENVIVWEKQTKKISSTDYKILSVYAKNAGVNLEGFRGFRGSISTATGMIDDLKKIVEQYPRISGGKRSVTISLDRSMLSKDFAITDNHIIRINANAFENISQLESEYEKLVNEGWFPKGTNYHAIIIHEAGHVVSNTYKINGLQIAKSITGIDSGVELIEYVKKELSQYAGAYENGQEIIAECFSCVYNGSGCQGCFMKKTVNRD